MPGQPPKPNSSSVAHIQLDKSSSTLYYKLESLQATEGLGAQAVCADFGRSKQLRLWTDSTAARGMAARQGLGRMKHLEVKFLWLQEVVMVVTLLQNIWKCLRICLEHKLVLMLQLWIF